MDTSTNIKVQQGFKPIKKGFIRYEGPEHHDLKPQFRAVGTEPLKKMGPHDRIVEWVDYAEVKNLLETAEKVFKEMIKFENEENKVILDTLKVRLGQWRELTLKG